MNIALYTRVSTADQLDNENPRAHMEFLRKYATQHNLTVTGEYVDDQFGWIPLGERPAGRQLLQDARRHQFDAVYVLRLDRMARLQKLLIESNDQLAALGVQFKSATESFDATTANGNFVFQLMGAVAELERKTLKERSNLGRHQKNVDGYWTQGPCPYGYDVVDKRLVLSQHLAGQTGQTEWEVVRGVYARMAAGSTLLAEAARLTASGVPSIVRSAHMARARGNGWFTTKISRMLHDTIYKGEKVIHLKNGNVTLPTPPLVDAETWAAAIAQIRHNRTYGGHRKHFYLLSGLIKCRCGYAATAFSTNDYSYYRCPCMCDTPQRHKQRMAGTPCTNRAIPTRLVDDTVWTEVRRLALTPNDALDRARALMAAERPDVDAINVQIQDTMKRIAHAQQARDRVLQLVTGGFVTMEQAKDRLHAINDREATDHADIEKLRTELLLAEAHGQAIAQASSTLEALAGALDDAEDDPCRQREAIALIVRHVTFDNTGSQPKLTIRWALPLNEFCVDMHASTRMHVHAQSNPPTPLRTLTWDSLVALGAPPRLRGADKTALSA